MTAERLAKLPQRIDDDTIQMLAAVLPRQRSTPEHLDQVLRGLATLPRRREDELNGKIKYAFYKRKLEKFDDETLSRMCSAALERHKFMPSIKECIDLCKELQSPDLHRAAQRKIQNELQARAEDTLDKIPDMEPEQINALPQRLKDIAVTRCLVRLDPETGELVKRGVPAG